MNIGQLNKRITFQKNVEVENEVGETVLEMRDYKTVWAGLAPMRGREYLEAMKIQAELTYKITVRFLTDVTPDMFIKYGTRMFRIQDIIDPFEYHEKLEIMCYEKVYKNV